MIESLTKYYGVDWAAMVSTFLWIYYTSEKKSICFIFAIIASIMWWLFGYLTESIASMIANAIFILLNIRGYLKWEKKY